MSNILDKNSCREKPLFFRPTAWVWNQRLPILDSFFHPLNYLWLFLRTLQCFSDPAGGALPFLLLLLWMKVQSCLHLRSWSRAFQSQCFLCSQTNLDVLSNEVPVDHYCGWLLYEPCSNMEDDYITVYSLFSTPLCCISSFWLSLDMHKHVAHIITDIFVL